VRASIQAQRRDLIVVLGLFVLLAYGVYSSAATEVGYQLPECDTSKVFNFADVPENSGYSTYARCLACRGVFSGYPDGTLRLDAYLTRGELAKMVSNAAGLQEMPRNQRFEDVTPGTPFFAAVQRLAARNLVVGYPCGGEGEPCGEDRRPYFRPDSAATRGQTARLVSDTAGFRRSPGEQIFRDVLPSTTFYDTVQRLSMGNMVHGYPCGGEGEPCNGAETQPYFRPYARATRGQAARIVTNTFFPDCNSP